MLGKNKGIERKLGNEGITHSELFKTINSLKMNDENLEEYLKFIKYVENLKPKRIGNGDFSLIEGKSYRGTSLASLIFPLYILGKAYTLKLCEGKKEIEIEYPLVTQDKFLAFYFANSRINKNGCLNKEIKERYQKQFYRIAEENGIKANMPEFFFQPIIIAFDEFFHDKKKHKSYEGICYNPVPNKTTLSFLAKLTETEVDAFKKEFPILSSKFSQ